ncbi:MAG: sensor histidine kinase [Chloroflexota bacterium]
MKSTKKHTRILMLMITSQVLLTVFVLQWLRSQYHEEKSRLENDLTTLYLEAQDEMVDTLLFRSYVSPVLRGKDDSLAKGRNNITGIVRLEGSKHVTVRLNQSHDPGAGLPDTIRLRKTNDDMLIRSVKMIISHAGDTLSDKPVTRNFGIIPDTTAFKIHFHNRLENAGMNFNLIWVSDSSENVRLKRTLYLAPLNPFALPPVSIENYNRYLAGKILPQVLFGILLVCLTALAFMLSYRSLRDHAILNNLRNEFVSNMTHELKTPVASISLALESLSKYNLKDDPGLMEEYMQLAQSETKRLEDLINRVLDHSLIEQDAGKHTFTATNVNNLVEDVSSTMQVRIQEKGSITFHPANRKLTVICDPLLIKGVIMNLLDNSIKYCDQAPVINISSSENDGFACIIVEDNGPGIPDEYKDKIFEKFFRVPSGNVHNVKGYGLGLSFASLVMKQHEGSIEVKNLGKGCSFILKIPLA